MSLMSPASAGGFFTTSTTWEVNDLLLAVYFIFILDSGNDVRQKADLSNFLIPV